MPQWLLDIPMDFWAVLAEMGPYLLFGFLAAGVLSVLISPAWVERNLGGGGWGPIVKASAFGVPLPLCSCSVIPVSASIRRHGASKGATTAFLISTPQTGVDSILATFSLLGWVYAIYRPIVALISGLLGGAVVSLTGKDDPASNAPTEACHEACCRHCQDEEKQPGRLKRMLVYGFVTLPQDIGLTLLIGIFIAALISALIPKGYFADLVPPGPWQILVLMLAGIPVYICATASIPVAAGLIVAGVSPGAAFALLMTGPATNAATVATIWKVLGRRTCLIYMATIMAGGFFGGLLLDQILTPQHIHHVMRHAGWLPAWVKHASAVALLAVLAMGILTGRKKHSHERT
ncbi:MAG: SO_0444 family Cu/Zn efflux transporter [Phycisphaerae bacterium]|nr:SO_0444 family Cu/Zn efflux transporter [Phycisphaerae bacterium]